MIPNPTRVASSRARAFRALAVLALALTAVPLAGCGASLRPLRLPSLRIPFVGRHAKAHEPVKPDAMRDARENAALDPNQPYWPFRAGEMYFAADSLAQAEAALGVALARDRHYAPALALLSKLYYQTGRHEQAVQMLEAARARPEAFPGGVPRELLIGLALHYEALERLDESRAVMAAVERAGPGEPQSAKVYMTLRGAEPNSAADLASALLHDDPRSAVNQNNYGVTRLRAGDPAGARKAFQSAIRIDPRLPGPYYNLAILEKYYTLDDEAAAKWYALYTARASEDPDGLAQVFAKPPVKELAEKRDDK